METNSPLVTVLLPTYNCEDYVRESIQSILNQTFGDFELIVIDDASTDRTIQVIEAFNDARIRLIRKPKNSGYTDSLNYGLGIARGCFIARMDADDISLPTRFEKQVAFLTSHKEVVLCGCWYQEIPNNHIAELPSEHEDIKVAMLVNNAICHPTVMFRKEFFVNNNLCYNKDFETSEDYELWTRLIAIGKVGNLSEVLLHYRIHEQQVSTHRVYVQYARAIVCRRRMLGYLMENWSEQEEDVLERLLTEKKMRNEREFEKAMTILNRLAQQNSIKGFYKKNEFLAFIENERKMAIRNFFILNSRFNIKLLQQFIRLKEDRKHLTRNERLRLAMKCLVSWNTKAPSPVV